MVDRMLPMFRRPWLPKDEVIYGLRAASMEFWR
jgi:hypothetical protein